MDDMKLLSTEAEGVNEAIAEEHRKALVNGAGRVGALLGLQSPQDSSSASADKEADSTGTALTFHVIAPLPATPRPLPAQASVRKRLISCKHGFPRRAGNAPGQY